MAPTLTLPFDHRYTTHCPFCGSLSTEWHPALRWGRCHAPGCGRSWTMTAPPPDEQKRIPSDFDLIDDCLVARRRKMTHKAAFDAYARMDVPGVTPERFERAWRHAGELV